VAYSPDGKTVASTDGGGVLLWDLQTGKEPTRLNVRLLHSFAFSPDGETLASADQDATMKLWDVQTGKERATFTSGRDRSLVPGSAVNFRAALSRQDREFGRGGVTVGRLEIPPRQFGCSLSTAENAAKTPSRHLRVD
jgi:WD40 repeat protein